MNIIVPSSSGMSLSQRTKILWARHPDIFLRDKMNRHLYLIEMAVAWDSIQEETRTEKQSKYGELRADLRTQFPGYHMNLVPVVIGGLGIGTHRLVEDLRCIPTVGKATSQTE